MTIKELETRLTIRAVDKYSGLVKKMQATTGNFADKMRREAKSLQNMRGSLKLLADFQSLDATTKQVATSLQEARAKTSALEAQFNATPKPTKDMEKALEKARQTSAGLARTHERNIVKLGLLEASLKDAGLKTSDLVGQQRRLQSSLTQSLRGFDGNIDRLRRITHAQNRFTESRKRMDRALATSANISFVGHAARQTGRSALTTLSGPVQQAIAFETAMADVKKVIDSDSFDSPDGFKKMSDDILALSTRIPMAAEGLAQIVAAGAQSGFETEELLQFAELAAKIGVAFDISAEQSGGAMANIKTALGLSLDETSALFDAMNHLSNKMASSAPNVLNFANRVVVDGAVKGFDPTQTLAFGSAMLAAGAQADVAATSFRNMSKALVRGESATPKQREAFQKLGLDVEEVAKRMQENAVGTTLDVMERINQLPEYLRSSSVSQIFGEEAQALTPLIGNLELLRKSLGLVSEEQNYLESANKEYAERAKTTANNIQLMRNKMTVLGNSIGSVVLPPLNDLLATTGAIVERFVQWTKEHPQLTKWLVIGSAAVAGMAVASGALLTAAAGLVGTMAVLRFGLAGVGGRALFAGRELLGLNRNFGKLAARRKLRLSRLIAPVRWGRALVSPVPWGRLLKPLSWVGLRLIPGIGWATLAGELSWHLLIKPLGWDKYLNMESFYKYADEIRTTIQSFGDAIGDDLAAGGTAGLKERQAKIFARPKASTPGPGGIAAQFRAAGGPVSAFRPYIINEHTPRSELFIPSQSGAVLNIAQAQSVLKSALPRPKPIGLAAMTALTLPMMTPVATAPPSAPPSNAVTLHIEQIVVQEAGDARGAVQDILSELQDQLRVAGVSLHGR